MFHMVMIKNTLVTLVYIWNCMYQIDNIKEIIIKVPGVYILKKCNSYSLSLQNIFNLCV